MKGLPRSRARGTPSTQGVVKKQIQFSKTLEVDGATGVGWGTVVVGDFPEGNVLFLGAVCYAQFQTSDTDVTATFDGDYALGTTPTADATVTGTDANLVGLTALGAATARVSPVVRATGVTAAIFDNTDGSLEINLNLIIDDATISADDVEFTASGVLEIVYAVLGDD